MTYTTFYDFINLLPYMEEGNKEENLHLLNNAEKPTYFLGSNVPDNLNLITFGQYADICDFMKCEDHIEAMRNIIKTLNDVTDEQIDNAPAYDVWGYTTWVLKEIGHINDLFSSVKVDYTDQEKKAGIEQLQFGTFGILDWYARRMGIADQNQVNNEKWVRIFQCMKNDAEETAYNRRLQKVYENEAKRH